MRISALSWCLLWAAGSHAGPARCTASRTAAALDGFLISEARCSVATPRPPDTRLTRACLFFSPSARGGVTLPNIRTARTIDKRHVHLPDRHPDGSVGSGTQYLDDLTASDFRSPKSERWPLLSEPLPSWDYDDLGPILGPSPTPSTLGHASGPAGSDEPPAQPVSNSDEPFCSAPGPVPCAHGDSTCYFDFEGLLHSTGRDAVPEHPDAALWERVCDPCGENYPYNAHICTHLLHEEGARTCGPPRGPPLVRSVRWLTWPPWERVSSYQRAWDELCIYVAFCPFSFDHRTTRRQERREIAHARKAYTNYTRARLTGCPRERRELDPCVCRPKAEMMRSPWTRTALLKRPYVPDTLGPMQLICSLATLTLRAHLLVITPVFLGGLCQLAISYAAANPVHLAGIAMLTSAQLFSIFAYVATVIVAPAMGITARMLACGMNTLFTPLTSLGILISATGAVSLDAICRVTDIFFVAYGKEITDRIVENSTRLERLRLLTGTRRSVKSWADQVDCDMVDGSLSPGTN